MQLLLDRRAKNSNPIPQHREKQRLANLLRTIDDIVNRRDQRLNQIVCRQLNRPDFVGG
jgi:hypothetical protein